MSPHTQVNASPITKITSWLKFMGKNLHLVGCATLYAKSEIMLIITYFLKKRVILTSLRFFGKFLLHIANFVCQETFKMNYTGVDQILIKSLIKMLKICWFFPMQRCKITYICHKYLYIFPYCFGTDVTYFPKGFFNTDSFGIFFNFQYIPCFFKFLSARMRQLALLQIVFFFFLVGH